jgi:hypothetical protein
LLGCLTLYPAIYKQLWGSTKHDYKTGLANSSFQHIPDLETFSVTASHNAPYSLRTALLLTKAKESTVVCKIENMVSFGTFGFGST